MKRETLHRLRAEAKRSGFEPSTQVLYALIDANLAVLDELEGGASVQEQRAALAERERQVRLALVDLREVLGRAGLAAKFERQEDAVDEISRATLVCELIVEMLRAKGAAWGREWSWYQPRIAEEFDGVATEV